LVQDAAVGYLTGARRTKDIASWRDRALGWAATDLNGAVRAPQPVSPPSGTGIADYDPAAQGAGDRAHGRSADRHDAEQAGDVLFSPHLSPGFRNRERHRRGMPYSAAYAAIEADDWYQVSEAAVATVASKTPTRFEPSRLKKRIAEWDQESGTWKVSRKPSRKS
jgi:hypothetical protein